MIADFYKTFDKSPDKGSDIPQEVLDILSEKLPSNFMYYKKEDGAYVVGPRPECMNEAMVLKVEPDPEFVKEHLEKIPRDKWAEYIYRMQLPVPVKNTRIGNQEKQIPIEETVGNPISEEVKIDKAFMYPEPFPPAKDLVFETVEGDKIVLSIVRKPYASLDEIYFTNENFPGITVQFYISETQEGSRITYSITPTKAETVSDALASIHLFNGFYHGTVKVDGKNISEPIISSDQFDAEKLKSITEFWQTAKALEEMLEVSFIPSAEFPTEDVEFFAQLENCLLRGKSVLWNHPFDHFHIGGITLKEGNFEEFLGKESVEYDFIEGPIHATLLGTEFDLYSETKLLNMVMTNIEWDDVSKKSGEVYVSDPVGSVWKLSRKYMTKEQRDKMGEVKPDSGEAPLSTDENS